MLGLFGKKDDAVPSWLERLKAGLGKTRSRLAGVFGSRRIDESFYGELETALLLADAGAEATQALIDELRARARKKGLEDAFQLKDELRAILVELLSPLERRVDCRGSKPFIIIVAGVNGAGKTTTIGKLAHFLQREGLSVLLAAGDTFRAAAREQLAAWGERNGVTVISQQSGDPAAVIFDAIHAARARNIDVVLADTAGRLPTQLHLMEEVKKIRRVIAKADASAPHEAWLVLDANTGQNALNQVRAFDEALTLTGLILTKLDGTAKGGVVAAIARARPAAAQAPSDRSQKRRTGPVPIVFVGLGEGVEDLRPFDAKEFVSALLD